MDYSRLNRKELQTLCKLHRIPANKTNVFMAEALGARLNDGVQKMESTPYASEVTSKVRLNRGSSSKKVAADVLEAEDFWSFPEYFVKDLLNGCKDVLAAGKDVHKAVVEVKMEVPPERSPESDVVAEPAKVPGWEQTMESMADPTEVAKSIARATPAVRSEKGAADVLEASWEANNLSSEFEKCTILAADSEYVKAIETGEETHEATTELTIEVPHELSLESDVEAEPAESSMSVYDAGRWSTPAKVVTQALKESAKADSELSDSSSLGNAAPVFFTPVSTPIFFTPVWSPGRWSSPAKALTESAKAYHSESSNSWRDDAPMFFTPAWSPGRCRTPSPAKVLREALKNSAAKSDSKSPSSPGDGALVFFTPIWQSAALEVG